MRYKGKEVVPIPVGTKYIPVQVYDASIRTKMAITDIEASDSAQYAGFGDNMYFWEYREPKPEQPTVETAKLRFIGQDFSSIDLTPYEGKKIIQAETAFANCKNLKTIDMSKLDFSSLDDKYGIYCMFEGCTSLTSVKLPDTSKIRHMSNLFAYCSSLKSVDIIDVSSIGKGWDGYPPENFVSQMFMCCGVTSVTFKNASAALKNALKSNPKKLRGVDDTPITINFV